MKEKLKEGLGKVKGFFKGLGKGVRIALIAGLAVVVLLVAGIVIFNSTRPYAVLFTDLDSEDMASVVSFLEDYGATDYKIQNNDTILVPESQESLLRAQILMDGSYPSSGFGYGTYLDNTGTLSSESDRERLDQYELQDRLGSTIELLDGVKLAAVTIAMEEDNRWILDEDDLKKASATVAVTMADGRSMSNDLANGIRSLVSTAVQGLTIDNITVIDQTGKTWSGGDELDTSESATLMLSLQAQVDEMIRNKIIDLLSPLYGAENLAVQVNSTVDVSKTYEESITYSYPDETAWNSLGGHGLIGEYVWDNSLIQGDDTTAGGVVGTTTNADLNEYVTEEGILDGAAEEIGASGSIEYDNDQTTVQKESAGGVITDIMVSVGINSQAVQAAGGATNNIDDLVAYVARAAGINADVEDEKIAITFRPFYTETEEPSTTPGISDLFVSDWLIFLLILGVALFFILLILVMILRAKARKHKQALRDAAEAQAAAEREAQEAAILQAMQIPPEFQGEEDEEHANIMDINSEKSMELRQDVRQFVEENPEIAAQMLKSWLRGEEGNG